MQEYRSTFSMRTAKIGYVITSVLLCAIGVLTLLFPEQAARFLGWALGAGMIFFGIVKLVGYFSKDLYRLAFQYDLAFGILLIALGVITLARPDGTLGFLCVMMGVEILADGLFKIQIVIDARQFGLKSWPWILALAILSGALGTALIIRPSEGARVLAMLLAVALLAEGILNLCVAMSAVKIVAHQKPDMIEVDEFHIV